MAFSLYQQKEGIRFVGWPPQCSVTTDGDVSPVMAGCFHNSVCANFAAVMWYSALLIVLPVTSPGRQTEMFGTVSLNHKCVHMASCSWPV